jgi:hypothetical protein
MRDADHPGSIRSTPNGREAREDGDLTKQVRRAQNWILVVAARDV